MQDIINSRIKKEIIELRELLNQLDSKNLKNFNKLCTDSIKAVQKGNKIFFYGNGGSAADAQHLATELKVKYKKKKSLFSPCINN